MTLSTPTLYSYFYFKISCKRRAEQPISGFYQRQGLLPIYNLNWLKKTSIKVGPALKVLQHKLTQQMPDSRPLAFHSCQMWPLVLEILSACNQQVVDCCNKEYEFVFFIAEKSKMKFLQSNSKEIKRTERSLKKNFKF